MPMPGPHNVSVSKIGLGWSSALSLGGALGLGWPGEGGSMFPSVCESPVVAPSQLHSSCQGGAIMCKFGPVSDPLLWPLLLL